MAHMNSDVIVVKISELLRDDQPDRDLVNEDTKTAMQEVIRELVGGNVLIEIDHAE